jgi:hypothetical protein
VTAAAPQSHFALARRASMECNPSVISEDTYVTVTRQKIPALLKRRAHSERAACWQPWGKRSRATILLSSD